MEREREREFSSKNQGNNFFLKTRNYSCSVQMIRRSISSFPLKLKSHTRQVSSSSMCDPAFALLVFYRHVKRWWPILILYHVFSLFLKRGGSSVRRELFFSIIFGLNQTNHPLLIQNQIFVFGGPSIEGDTRVSISKGQRSIYRI